MSDFQDYDLGLMNDYGGGNVSWWHDYLRSAVDGANESAYEQYAQLEDEIKSLQEQLAAEKARAGKADAMLKGVLDADCDGCDLSEERLDKAIKERDYFKAKFEEFQTLAEREEATRTETDLGYEPTK